MRYRWAQRVAHKFLLASVFTFTVHASPAYRTVPDDAGVEFKTLSRCGSCMRCSACTSQCRSCDIRQRNANSTCHVVGGWVDSLASELPSCDSGGLELLATTTAIGDWVGYRGVLTSSLRGGGVRVWCESCSAALWYFVSVSRAYLTA